MLDDMATPLDRCCEVEMSLARLLSNQQFYLQIPLLAGFSAFWLPIYGQVWPGSAHALGPASLKDDMDSIAAPAFQPSGEFGLPPFAIQPTAR
jgi:hypothetical protein